MISIRQGVNEISPTAIFRVSYSTVSKLHFLVSLLLVDVVSTIQNYFFLLNYITVCSHAGKYMQTLQRPPFSYSDGRNFICRISGAFNMAGVTQVFTSTLRNIYY
jgi:hypothetical protein